MLAATVGVGGVLVLSSSQPIFPVAAAYLNHSAGSGPAQIQNGVVGQLPPALTLPSLDPPTASPLPLVAPVAPVAANQPYGLANTAGLTSSGIPQAAYQAYVNAAAELTRTDPGCHLSWTVIAGIGRVESNHGRFGGSSINAAGLVAPPILGIRLDGSRPGTARISDSDNGVYDGDKVTDRAVGPMQFLPGTWKIYGGGLNPQNMNAAALATARYLCVGNASLATQAGRWAAVYRYNHSDSYVSLVLSLADSYATGKVNTFPSPPGGSSPPSTDPPATAPGPPPAVPTPPAAKPSTSPTPTATPTAKPTRTTAPSPTSSATPTSPTSSGTPTPSASATPSAGSPTSTSASPSPSESPTPSPTPSDSPTSGSTTSSESTSSSAATSSSVATSSSAVTTAGAGG